MKKTIFILLLISTWVTCVAQRAVTAVDFQHNKVTVVINGTTVKYKGKSAETIQRYCEDQQATIYFVCSKHGLVPLLTIVKNQMPVITNSWAFK